MRPLAALLLLAACQREPPYAELPAGGDAGGSDGSDGGTDDTGGEGSGAEGGDGGWSAGDPLEIRGWAYLDMDPEEIDHEWLAAEILPGGRHGVITGAPGLGIVDLQDPATEPGENTGLLAWERELRGFLLAMDGDTLFVGTHWAGLYSIDLTDPLAPALLAEADPAEGYHEDIAADGGLVFLAAQEEGAILLEGLGLTELARIPTTRAAAVALDGDRGLVVDDVELGLYDLSEPSAPVLLDVLPLPAEGRDLAVDGDRVAVALGGRGMLVVDRAGDLLTERGQLEAPGAVLSVDLAGEYLWFAAWETAGVAWVGEGEPVVLGHELPLRSAMSIAGDEERAVFADWNVATVLDLSPGLGGAELHLPEEHFVPRASEEASALSVQNHGALPLSLAVDAGETGWTVEPEALELAPGEGSFLRLTPPAGGPVGEAALAWTSSDPDEATGELRLVPASASLGRDHVDVVLPAFDWPDTSLHTVDLDDHLGEVVLLAYFASW